MAEAMRTALVGIFMVSLLYVGLVDRLDRHHAGVRVRCANNRCGKGDPEAMKTGITLPRRQSCGSLRRARSGFLDLSVLEVTGHPLADAQRSVDVRNDLQG